MPHPSLPLLRSDSSSKCNVAGLLVFCCRHVLLLSPHLFPNSPQGLTLHPMLGTAAASAQLSLRSCAIELRGCCSTTKRRSSGDTATEDLRCQASKSCPSSRGTASIGTLRPRLSGMDQSKELQHSCQPRVGHGPLQPPRLRLHQVPGFIKRKILANRVNLASDAA